MRYWKAKPIRGEPRLGIGVAAYWNGDNRRVNAAQALIASFQAQTWSNWRMIITHDGPIEDTPWSLRLRNYIASDTRIQLVVSEKRVGSFGHTYRQRALSDLCSNCHWICLTNDDNYYAPTFIEWLISAAQTAKPEAQLSYCDMIHSHQFWRFFNTAPKYKSLDLGGFIVNASVAKQVPFDKFTFNGDGDWLNRLTAKVKKAIVKVPAVLFVHN
jgi:hypothetical protein